MRFSDDQIASLRSSVEKRLSQKRYLHTLGVETAAKYIGGFFNGIDVTELSAAALLHDITKEYSEAEQEMLLKSNSAVISDDDITAVIHSLTAPYAILTDFPEYATSDVLSAVRNHTLGSSDMSIFDEIIFISDYVEAGRTYPSCIEVRESLYQEIESANSVDERYMALHRAVTKSLDFTISSLRAKGSRIHKQTAATLNAFAEKLNYYKEKL